MRNHRVIVPRQFAFDFLRTCKIPKRSTRTGPAPALDNKYLYGEGGSIFVAVYALCFYMMNIINRAQVVGSPSRGMLADLISCLVDRKILLLVKNNPLLSAIPDRLFRCMIVLLSPDYVHAIHFCHLALFSNSSKLNKSIPSNISLYYNLYGALHRRRTSIIIDSNKHPDVTIRDGGNT